MRTCTHVTAEGVVCPRRYKAKGLCLLHYQRRKAGTPMDAAVQPRGQSCTHVATDGTPCARPHRAHGLCSLHYERRARGRPMDGPPKPAATCRMPECGRKRTSRDGLCLAHARKRRESPWAWSGPLQPHPATNPVPMVSLGDVVVPHAHRDALDEEARARGVKRTVLVREALALWVRQREEEGRQRALWALESKRGPKGPRRAA